MAYFCVHDAFIFFFFNLFTRFHIPPNPIKLQSQLSTVSFVLNLSCQLTSCSFTSPALSKPLSVTVCHRALYTIYSMPPSALPWCTNKTGLDCTWTTSSGSAHSWNIGYITKRMRPSRETAGRFTESPTNDWAFVTSYFQFKQGINYGCPKLILWISIWAYFDGLTSAKVKLIKIQFFSTVHCTLLFFVHLILFVLQHTGLLYGSHALHCKNLTSYASEEWMNVKNNLVALVFASVLTLRWQNAWFYYAPMLRNLLSLLSCLCKEQCSKHTASHF